MKSVKFIFFILLLITQTNLCFATARLTDAEKTVLTTGTINSVKAEENSVEDLDISKVKLSLERNLKYLNIKAKKINFSEVKKFLDDFDKNYSGKTSAKQDDLSTFLNQKVDELNNAPFIKASAQEACNFVFCKDELMCAVKFDEVRKPGIKCQKDVDCGTGVCSHEKFCERPKICYVPAGLGQSCMLNPCAIGSGASCVEINTDTNGIGQCIHSRQNKSCKSNVECCSNKCEQGKCVQNKLCRKECSTTKTSKQQPTCCDGYFKMPDGKCDSGFYIVPPPLDTPNEKNHSLNLKNQKSTKNLFSLITSFFIDSAEAQIVVSANTGSASEVATAKSELAAAQAKANTARKNYCASPACDVSCVDVNIPSCASDCASTTDPNSGCAAVKSATKQLSDLMAATPPPCVDAASTDPMGNPITITTCTPEVQAAQQALAGAQAALPALKDAVSKAYEDVSLKTEVFKAIDQKTKANSNVNSIKDSAIGYSELKRKSDLNTCSIDLVSDYRILLQKARADGTKPDGAKDQPYDGSKSTMFDLQMAMAAFDFVAGGTLADDYFLDVNTHKSVNKRLNEIAITHAANREAALAKLQTNSDRLTCQCYKIKIEVYRKKLEDIHKASYTKFSEVTDAEEKIVDTVCGPDKEPDASASDEVKKDYADGKIEKDILHDYLKKLIENTPTAAMDDSDGTKAAHFLTTLSDKLHLSTKAMFADYTNTYEDLAKLSTDYQDAIKNNVFKSANDEAIFLYDYNYTQSDGWGAQLSGFLGKVFTTVFSDWLGITTDSDYCGWSTRFCHTGSTTPPAGELSAPLAQLNIIHAAWSPSTNSSGTAGASPSISEPYLESRAVGTVGHGNKWNHSTTYLFKKFLHMPSNNVCAADGSHFSSAACIKHFAQYDQHTSTEDNFFYILDPLIPVSYSSSKSITIAGATSPQVNGHSVVANDLYPEEKLTKLIEDGYIRGRDYLIANQRDVHDTGTSLIAAEKSSFLPYFGGARTAASSDTFYEANYKKLQDCPGGAPVCAQNAIIKKIKDNAKIYAVESKLFSLTDAGIEDNLNKFADYAYQFHFILPKQSRYGLVSNAPEVAQLYYETLAHGVMAPAAQALYDAEKVLDKQHLDYQNYEQQLLETYPAAPGSIEALAQSERLAQIEAVKKAYKTLSSPAVGTKVDSSSSGILNLGGMGAMKAGSASIGAPAATFSEAQALINSMTAQQLAVRKYNNIRNAQLSKVAAVQKAAANTPDGLARLAQINKAASNFNSSLSSPLSGRGSNFNGATSSSNTVNNYAPAKSNETPAKFNKPNFYAPIDSGSTRNGGGGGSSAESAPTMDPNSESAKNAKILQDAIDARNKSGKDKYNNGDEGQTIFDIITNTYIRNYDKVLIKKDATK